MLNGEKVKEIYNKLVKEYLDNYQDWPAKKKHITQGMMVAYETILEA